MVAIPLKPAYRPTLAQLLAPSWRRAPRALRGVLLAFGVACVALLAALVLALLPARLTVGGPVPFHFSYRALYRVRPQPGGYATVRRLRHGALEDSFSVQPLQLPPYRGSLSGQLPLYASTYIRSLARHDPQFQLLGEGKTRVNTVPGYNIFYTTRLARRLIWGRVILLLPEQPPGVRRGVALVLLTTPSSSRQVKNVLEIATAGVLQQPLHTFTFG